MKSKKIIYVFDFLGEFIESLPIGDVAIKYLNGDYSTLRSYVTRMGLYKKFYYFLETKDFIVKKKKAEPNKFLQKDRSYQKAEERAVRKYTYEDKIQIINKVKSDIYFAEKYNVSVSVIHALRSKWRSQHSI